MNIKPLTIETLRRGLRKVVETGTASPLNSALPNLPPVAGKTGTAEDSSGGQDHAWFVCFAPFKTSISCPSTSIFNNSNSLLILYEERTLFKEFFFIFRME